MTMCFTPAISLTTAIIEFAVVVFILMKYKRNILTNFWVIFILILGVYQFTEFMVCNSINPILWAYLGFSAYMFLPAVGLHFALNISKIKTSKWPLYILPIIGILAVFSQKIITNTKCSRFFIETSIFPTFPFTIYSLSYLMYYFGYILIIYIILIKHAKKSNKLEKQIVKIIAWSFALITIIPLTLIIILSHLNVLFPSIYCEFAILFSIVALITCEIDNRKRKK